MSLDAEIQPGGPGPTIDGRLFELPAGERLKRPPLPDIATGIGRIALVITKAREEEVASGASWYQDVHEQCERFAEEFDITMEAAAGIVAALSPRLGWADNLSRARDLMSGREISSLGYALDDARRIMAGKTVAEVLFDPSRSNFKVRAFFSNIYSPEESPDVTIDRHMWALLFDTRGISDTLLKFSQAEYRYAEEVFRESARFAGYRPCQIQAIAWVVWRRIHGVSSVSVPHPSLF